MDSKDFDKIPKIPKILILRLFFFKLNDSEQTRGKEWMTFGCSKNCKNGAPNIKGFLDLRVFLRSHRNFLFYFRCQNQDNRREDHVFSVFESTGVKIRTADVKVLTSVRIHAIIPVIKKETIIIDQLLHRQVK